MKLRKRWFWQRLRRHYQGYRSVGMKRAEALDFAWRLTWDYRIRL